MDALLDSGASARLSPCGQYRYELGRRWGDGPYVCWVMLNPSTADASVDDRTIRKCIKFSRAWGYAALVVVNLFAYRATDPKVLKTVDDPVGPDNDDAIRKAAAGAALILAGWGKHGVLHGRDDAVADALSYLSQPTMALAVNGDGSPKHPLYIKDETMPQAWGGK